MKGKVNNRGEVLYDFRCKNSIKQFNASVRFYSLITNVFRFVSSATSRGEVMLQMLLLFSRIFYNLHLKYGYVYHRNYHLQYYNAAPAYRLWLFAIQVKSKTKVGLFVIIDKKNCCFLYGLL